MIDRVALLRRLPGAALDLAFPAVCSGCRHEGLALCRQCVRALDARLDLPGGTPIGLPADLPAPLLQLEWCAPFAGPVRAALHDLKYAGERRLGVPLGEAIARRWARVGVGAGIVVPVPIHAERERRRGYDQAALIADVAARSLGLPMARVLERRRATVAQFELGRDDRAANVEGAFMVAATGRGSRSGRASSGGRDGAAGTGIEADRVRGAWVLLVDDVVTTGSTLAACANTMRDAGAVAVSAITVARER